MNPRTAAVVQNVAPKIGFGASKAFIHARTTVIPTIQSVAPKIGFAALAFILAWFVISDDSLVVFDKLNQCISMIIHKIESQICQAEQKRALVI